MAWRSDVGASPSGLVVADGKVLVAAVDAHTVHALSAADGESLWTHTAGGRVDSPPTFYSFVVPPSGGQSRAKEGRPPEGGTTNSLCLFGSADGRVTCLRASDGAVVWRFDAAPRRRLVTAFDQLESPWPVPGSVLVHDGKCWLAAGRSSYLDGGIHLFALDPATGRVDRQETIYSPDPKTGKMPPEPSPHSIPGLLNDIPATDGSNVFIRQMNVSSPGDPARRHLFTTGGYLDSSWFNRTFWKVDRVQTTGIMVLGHDVVYGVEVYALRGSRESVFTPGSQAYRLTCYSLLESAAGGSANRAKRRGKGEPGRKVIWEQHVPIRITAMVRAADRLFVAGSPDTVDPEDPHGAWEGRKGGVLAVFDAGSGEKLAQVKLDAPPVWDGMAAARGCLFISTMDGRVVCLGG